MKKLQNILFFLALTLTTISCAHKQPAYKKDGTFPFVGTSQVHRFTYPNGLKLLVLEDHSAPVFAYQTWFNVGSRDEEKGLTGLAHLFEHMMFKATKNHPEGEFDHALESAGAEGVNAFTSKDYTAYIQNLPSRELEMLASYESDRMVNLIVNDPSLDKEREVVQNERRFRNENSPDGTLYERLYDLAYHKHAYHWPVIGYAEDLNHAKSQQCLAFYKRFYAPNNATIAIVGDVDAEKTASLINKLYGKLPASQIVRTHVEMEPIQKKEIRENKKLKIAVEKLTMGYHTVGVKHPDFPALEVLRGILASGKSSRLYQKLVDSGVATGADIENSEQKDPGLMIFFVDMQKGRTANEALTAIDKEIENIQAGHINDAEIRRTISQQRFAIFDDQVTHYARARFIGFYETVASDFSYGLDILERMKSVTKADIVRVAKTYLNPTTRTIVIGQPASKVN